MKKSWLERVHMLEIRELSAYYGDVQVLWEINFRIEDREIVSVLGPNGAGKTTTINSISGLAESISGQILFGARPVAGLLPHRIVDLGICQIPEGRRVFSEMSVWENLELGAYGKRARQVRHRTLRYVFELFPVLARRRDQLAGTLSGGEQQMLAIGRGLMSRPKLLMIDEPSLGLSPLLVEDLFRTILRLNAEEVTVLLVEQNVQQALAISHRAYVLETGRIVLEGKGGDLLHSAYVREAYMGL